MKFKKFICLVYILLIILICLNIFLMHLKLHYRIALINNEQSEYIKHSDFFNFDDFKRYRHKNKKLQCMTVQETWLYVKVITFNHYI